jgi:hypothetical protein
MHYFVYGQNIAAVEDVEQAAKYAAAGWRAVSREVFLDAWKRRDARDLARIWTEAVPMEAAAVRRPGAVVERLPGGWVRYSA